MGDAGGILVFISKLPAGSGARVPIDLEVIRSTSVIQPVGGIAGIQDGHRHRRAMDATIALAPRHPLDAMPAGFMMELIGSGTIQCDGQSLMPAAPVGSLRGASFSTLAGGEIEIGVS